MGNTVRIPGCGCVMSFLIWGGLALLACSLLAFGSLQGRVDGKLGGWYFHEAEQIRARVNSLRQRLEENDPDQIVVEIVNVQRAKIVLENLVHFIGLLALFGVSLLPIVGGAYFSYRLAVRRVEDYEAGQAFTRYSTHYMPRVGWSRDLPPTPPLGKRRR